ncbi:MAG: Flp family type IVb pilin [Porphyrobacter sp.]|nr:Flp family type IVb pilin [Porphyrobacter sp.]
MLTTFLRTMKDDNTAATAIEYGLITALIVLGMLVSLQLVADSTIEMWTNVKDRVQEVMGT